VPKFAAIAAVLAGRLGIGVLGAVSLGIRALVEDRKSPPSLLMVSRDLTKGSPRPVLRRGAQTQDYLDQLTALTRAVLELVHPVNSGD
jgi:hypothetical protein